MSRKNPWYDASKAHHTPDGFCNPEGEQRKPGDLQRWRRERKAQHLPPPPASGYADFSARWYQQADLSGSDDRIWWLGHAALLLRLKQRYILIDPALSPRASPLPFAGPERRVPSPLDVARLPQLDYVLISHNHYDHLDRDTIKRLLRCFPEVKMMVPLGLGAWCRKRGARNVTEMDWWESADSQDLSITAVPARHWSMRTLWDRNRSLWCGWVVRCGTLNFWFSGDSGYSDSLLQIAQRLGPFNLAALPVGAYAPEWFMSSQHMNPQQAVELWQYAGHPLTIPIHWGVYELADEALDAPPAELQRVLDAAGTPLAGRFSPWRIGESRTLSDIE